MMSLEDALITCLLHSSKEQWIILLVYWAASQLHKCLFLLFWPAFDRLASPSSIKRHFLIMRIRPVNKENNPLFFAAMDLHTLKTIVTYHYWFLPLCF